MTNTKQLNNLARLLATALDTYNDARNDDYGRFVLGHFGDEYEVQYSPYEIGEPLVTTLVLKSDSDFVQAIKDVTTAIAEAL